jgi:hypothetical protein
MRKIVAVAVCLVFVFASLAFAGTAKDNTGCGLGTMLWKDNADGSSVSQAFQATTNGTSGAQTFGISSGTSECKQPSSFVQNEELNKFVRFNMDNLAKDIAKGKGETLDTLVELLHIAPDQKAKFVVNVQANFSRIYSSDKVEFADVVDGIIAASHIS